MPWKAQNIMSLKHEFVLLARQEGVNRRELCRRFEISPQTGYKWLQRFAREGVEGLQERSRRPANSPAISDAELEQAVVALRHQHPAWVGRKISRRLLDVVSQEVVHPR